MFAFILVSICIMCGAVGQILMKTGVSHIDKIGSWTELFRLGTISGIFTNGYVLGGLILYAASSFLWLGALSTLNVSRMYPLLSLAYVVTAVLGFIFLKENISLMRWAGIALVIAGCFLILRS
jgi:drug/metabolite transporter (DMT)-like permease